MALRKSHMAKDSRAIFTCLSSDTKPTETTHTNLRVWDIAIETDTGNKYEYRGATVGWVNTDINGAASVAEQGIIGGGRNEDDQTNNYTVTHRECNKTFFNPDAATEQVISSAPAFLYGFVGKVGTGTFTLRDSATAAGVATDFPVYTLAVGTMVTFPAAIRMENGITAQCGTLTDEVTIFWRPI